MESELQAATEVAKKLAEDLEKRRKVEAEKAARLKAAADARNRKNRIARKAAFDILSIDFEDVLSPVVPSKSDPKRSAAQNTTPPDPKPLDNATPASKQVANQTKKPSLWNRLNEKI